jgi:hypothetical protein
VVLVFQAFFTISLGDTLTLGLAWSDGTVPRIAQAIYDDRKMPEGTLDTSRLATLADALLDAGCDNEALI